MASAFSLSLLNPAAPAEGPSNVVYTDASNGNSLNLTITNNSGFQVEIGGSAVGKYLYLLIPDSLINTQGAMVLNAAAPWKIESYAPPPQPGAYFKFSLLPPNNGLSLANKGSLTISLTGFVAAQKGNGTLIINYQLNNNPHDDLNTSGLLLAMAQGSPKLSQLFGNNNPLYFQYGVNVPDEINAISTTPLAPDNNPDIIKKYIIYNKIFPSILNQNIESLYPAPSGTNTNWPKDKPPTLAFFFEYFDIHQRAPADQDLTDCLKDHDQGYSALTSAWNIPFSLDPVDPTKTSNDYWDIHLVPSKSNATPTWLVQPNFRKNQIVFDQGEILKIFISKIVSSMPVGTDFATLIYLQWYDFPNYNDGILARQINKTRPFYLISFTSNFNDKALLPQGYPLQLFWQSYGAVRGELNINENGNTPTQIELSFAGLAPPSIFDGSIDPGVGSNTGTFKFNINVYSEDTGNGSQMLSSDNLNVQIVPQFDNFDVQVLCKNTDGSVRQIVIQWSTQYTPDYFTLNCVNGNVESNLREYILNFNPGDTLPDEIVLTAVFESVNFSCSRKATLKGLLPAFGTGKVQIQPVSDPSLINIQWQAHHAPDYYTVTDVDESISGSATSCNIPISSGYTFPTQIVLTAVFKSAGFSCSISFDMQATMIQQPVLTQGNFDFKLSKDRATAYCPSIGIYTFDANKPPYGKNIAALGNNYVAYTDNDTAAMLFTLTPEGNIFFTTAYGPDIIPILYQTNPANNPNASNNYFKVGDIPFPIVIAPDGSLGLVVNQNNGTMSYFNPKSPPGPGQTAPTFPFGLSGSNDYLNFNPACSIAFTEDSKQVFITCFTDNSLYYFNNELPNLNVHKISLPDQGAMSNIAFSPDESTLYFSNSNNTDSNIYALSAQNPSAAPSPILTIKGDVIVALACCPGNGRVFLLGKNLYWFDPNANGPNEATMIPIPDMGEYAKFVFTYRSSVLLIYNRSSMLAVQTKSTPAVSASPINIGAAVINLVPRDETHFFVNDFSIDTNGGKISLFQLSFS